MTHSFPTRRSSELPQPASEAARWRLPGQAQASAVKVNKLATDLLGTNSAPAVAAGFAASGGKCVRAARPTASSAIRAPRRSEEHTSELQSLMRISYDVFCLKKKIRNISHVD